MSDELVVLDGSSFFVSNRRGDADGRGATGFFHDDMRHLSRWELLVDGKPIRVLTSRVVDYYSARVFATLPSDRVGDNPPLSVQRDRIVSDGVHEDLFVENHGVDERPVHIELRFDADFADLFEVKDHIEKRGRRRVEVGEGEVTLWYERGEYQRGTRLVFDHTDELEANAIRFDISIPPRARWELCIDVRCVVDGEERAPRAGHGGFGHLEPQMPMTLDEWMTEAPSLDTDDHGLRQTYRQSLLDLAALRFRPFGDVERSLPAAGLPWFMALFGRDSLVTAYQALPYQPQLAAATLTALASQQATEHDDFRDAEPGKILHELRRGELTALGERPHSPYYGAHDATPLFLVLLDEYERWTGDTDLVSSLEGAARAALAWIEGPGDLDGDGYLEYQRRSPAGLDNQCWKDSHNSILFADARVAEPPIATCEIQGYAYDARVRMARLAREVWDDHALADRVAKEAAVLKERFNRDFWHEDRGHFVLALDGDKRPVDAMTSNVGHLLWSGIVDDEHAAAVVPRLMAPAMFSGWGVRTMSSDDAGYNPIEYHNGTVWPHDTSLVAEGLRRYGAREEASLLVGCLLDAASCFDHQLPEVFAGFSRAATTVPVEYPTPSRPQAWAAGAVLLGLRTLLGLEPHGEQLRVATHLPENIGHLGLTGIPYRHHRVDAEAGMAAAHARRSGT